MTCRTCHEQADFQGVFSWDRKKAVNGPADLKVRRVRVRRRDSCFWLLMMTWIRPLDRQGGVFFGSGGAGLLVFDAPASSRAAFSF